MIILIIGTDIFPQSSVAGGFAGGVWKIFFQITIAGENWRIEAEFNLIQLHFGKLPRGFLIKKIAV